MDDTEARKDLATAEASLASSRLALQTQQQGGTAAERVASTADIEAARAQVQQSANSLAALEKLQAQGAASANEVEGAAHVDSAQAKLTELQATKGARYSADIYERSGAWLRRRKRAWMRRSSVCRREHSCTICGNGLFASRLTPYQFVPGGRDDIQVAKLKKLQIRAYFDEPEIGQLKVGSL